MAGHSDRERQQQILRGTPQRPVITPAEFKQFGDEDYEPALPTAARGDMRGDMSARHTMMILDAIDELALEIRAVRADIRRSRTSMEKHMAAIDDQLDAGVIAAEAEDTKIDSMIELFKTMVKPVGLTPDQQAKFDKIMLAIGDNADRIQAAIDANTPPAPAPAE